MKTEHIAKLAHEVNAAYCRSIGDNSQPAWGDAPDWQVESALAGVDGVRSGAIGGPGDSHRSWLDQKERDGWKHGPVKDPAKKEHPCMVSFEELPVEQQVKDHLFFAVVKTCLGIE